MVRNVSSSDVPRCVISRLSPRDFILYLINYPPPFFYAASDSVKKRRGNNLIPRGRLARFIFTYAPVRAIRVCFHITSGGLFMLLLHFARLTLSSRRQASLFRQKSETAAFCILFRAHSSPCRTLRIFESLFFYWTSFSAVAAFVATSARETRVRWRSADALASRGVASVVTPHNCDKRERRARPWRKSCPRTTTATNARRRRRRRYGRGRSFLYF